MVGALRDPQIPRPERASHWYAHRHESHCGTRFVLFVRKFTTVVFNQVGTTHTVRAWSAA